MKRLFSILVLIGALVALGAPSLALGMNVRGPVWTSSDGGVSELADHKIGDCKGLGGKRVLPCHPDQGVIGDAVFLIAAPGCPEPLWSVGLKLTETTPEAELPPPRAC